MRFSTDEIKPFYEVRQNLSKIIDEVVDGGAEVVIAKHGRPVAAVLSAERLYRYREADRAIANLLSKFQNTSSLNRDELRSLIAEFANLPSQAATHSGN